MLFEGWIAPGSGRPSRHPKRREAIVAALHEPGSCETTTILFRRTPAGVEFGERDTEQAESRWSELQRSGVSVQ
jgi:hypothetical protein